MKKEQKRKAVELLSEKIEGKVVAYADIALETGYSTRQPRRMAKRIREEGEGSVPTHGNSGPTPHNRSSADETAYLRKLKEPYPSVTTARLRDIRVEGVLESPEESGDAERCGLAPRSASWFRGLFARGGWKSPAQRAPARDGDGRRRPKREPMPRTGMMAQVDATPHDRTGDGEARNTHLAVGDATTATLGGWLMPRECPRGHARVTKEATTSHGIPKSAHSDKDPAFRSAKDGSPTQCAHMPADLGIQTVFASTPQAKGRVERCNRTARLRPPADVIRFGIRDCDTPSRWLNDLYAPYPNGKLSWRPKGPTGDFAPPRPQASLGAILGARERRASSGRAISYQNTICLMADEDGVMPEVPDETVPDVHVDVMTEGMYVEHGGRRWRCVAMTQREGRGPIGVQDRRELQHTLKAMRGGSAARES